MKSRSKMLIDKRDKLILKFPCINGKKVLTSDIYDIFGKEWDRLDYLIKLEERKEKLEKIKKKL